MKKIGLITGLLLFVLTAVQAQYFGTQKERQVFYQKVLSDLDIKSALDEKGNITFDYGGHTCCLFTSTKLNVFHVVMLNVDHVEEEVEKTKATVSANRVNAARFAAKVFIDKHDKVRISVEQFTAEKYRGDWKTYMPAILEELGICLDLYREGKKDSKIKTR